MQEREFERPGSAATIHVDVRDLRHTSESCRDDQRTSLARRPLLSARRFPHELPPLRQNRRR